MRACGIYFLCRRHPQGNAPAPREDKIAAKCRIFGRNRPGKRRILRNTAERRGILSGDERRRERLRGVRMAGRFSDAWLDELRSRVSIEEIVSEYVPLKRKGRRSWGLCPFHNEKTPSFSVDTETQLFYCFGCHKGGSVIQFVMEMERLDFSEAVKLLAERAHLPLPEGSPRVDPPGQTPSARTSESASTRPTSRRRVFFTPHCGQGRARRRFPTSISAASPTRTSAISASASPPAAGTPPSNT